MDLKLFILTFILGGASVFFVFGLNLYFLDKIPFYLNGNIVNDFLYCFLNIGIVEELAKLIPFVFIYFLFKKEITEPMDFLIYISISALGFSAVENSIYFYKHGPDIINGRAILATVGHMFDTSLIAYGIIRFKYYPKKQSLLIIIWFFIKVCG